MENHNDMELDLLELFHYLKKKLWLVAAAAVLFAALGFAVSQFLMTPQYTASTRMYVLNRTNATNVVYADIQTSTYLLTDYKVLITGENVTKEVIEILDLDCKPRELERMIEVTAPENTRVLQINVSAPDPKLASEIANCVRVVSSAQIEEIMDVDAVKLVYEAAIPEKPSSPHVQLNTIIAGALGMFAAVFVLVIAFMLDDTIRTEEDVERRLGLGTLGVIPSAAELDAAQAGSAGAKRPVKGKRGA